LLAEGDRYRRIKGEELEFFYRIFREGMRKARIMANMCINESWSIRIE
jgi:hypothetical protein